MLLPKVCPGCGSERIGHCAACSHHLRLVRPPQTSVAPFSHDGVPRRMVLGLKYRNARSAAKALALPMALSVPDPGFWDAVTWAPTSARRIADRGYDPAEVLAREVAALLGLPCRRLLRRSRHSTPQHGKGRTERLTGPDFVGRPLWRAPRVLLVDDVTTTGATLREAKRALIEAGASRVRCLAATAAP